jgi:hypothetical protein
MSPATAVCALKTCAASLSGEYNVTFLHPGNTHMLVLAVACAAIPLITVVNISV